MDRVAIVRWAPAHGESMPDICQRVSYRCAAYLLDGTYLPCVQLREESPQVDLAIRRFCETSDDRSIVAAFVTGGSRVNAWDIERLEPSPYAIPLDKLRQVKGETSMSWTAFAAVMDDGSEFSFGTSYPLEFFDMPPGYTGKRVASIIPHKSEQQPVYREKPFFVCFLEGSPSGAV